MNKNKSKNQKLLFYFVSYFFIFVGIFFKNSKFKIVATIPIMKNTVFMTLPPNISNFNTENISPQQAVQSSRREN